MEQAALLAALPGAGGSRGMGRKGPAVVIGALAEVLALWPKRAPGLPPGQRQLDVFPRFSDNPLRRPPPLAPGGLLVEGGTDSFSIGMCDLATLEARAQQTDFHCVTTWTHQGACWGGVSMTDVWARFIGGRPGVDDRVEWILAKGADGFQAVMRRDDLLDPSVMLATTLGGAPLSELHGAPLRLVSPLQYGYKSVKHLVGFELCTEQPAGRLGAKEHPRGRVALEERHAWLPGRVVRAPYRLLIAPTAMLAERSAR